jgi:hypothetical protein
MAHAEPIRVVAPFATSNSNGGGGVSWRPLTSRPATYGRRASLEQHDSGIVDRLSGYMRRIRPS